MLAPCCPPATAYVLQMTLFSKLADMLSGGGEITMALLFTSRLDIVG